jgi:type I restriction enzyme S subunit
MELREELKSGVFDTKDWLEAPAIPDFLLDGKPIEIITINQKAFTLSPQPSLFEPMPIIAPETTITTTMQTFPQYATYKDSGIEWLGKIPEHWKIFPLKRALNGCTNGLWGSDPKGLCDITVLRVADFDRQKLIVSDEKLTIRSIPIKDRENRLLKKGDLLIEKSGGGEKTLVGCVVYFDKEYEAITSNFVAKITPKSDFDGRFLNYAFSTLYSLRVNYLSIKQTTGIQNLDTESYFKESFAFPTETEQTAIANFLDQKTAQIDAAIAIKEQQIALLKERKQIIIQQAVTQGLDPNVPMKDSGVEWIGEIPAHWEVKKLRYTSGK